MFAPPCDWLSNVQRFCGPPCEQNIRHAAYTRERGDNGKPEDFSPAAGKTSSRNIEDRPERRNHRKCKDQYQNQNLQRHITILAAPSPESSRTAPTPESHQVPASRRAALQVSHRTILTRNPACTHSRETPNEPNENEAREDTAHRSDTANHSGGLAFQSSEAPGTLREPFTCASCLSESINFCQSPCKGFLRTRQSCRSGELIR